MIGRDYIMRMIQQIVQALLHIVKLKKIDPQEALNVIDETSKNVLGIDGSLADMLSAEDLVSLLKINDPTGYEKCLMMARLLKEKGDTYSFLNKEQDSFNFYLKAIRILISIKYTDIKNDIVSPIITIEEVVEKVDNYELPKDIKNYLYQYYKSTGLDSKAEEFV
jgi:hypothetical protein